MNVWHCSGFDCHIFVFLSILKRKTTFQVHHLHNGLKFLMPGTTMQTEKIFIHNKWPTKTFMEFVWIAYTLWYARTNHADQWPMVNVWRLGNMSRHLAIRFKLNETFTLIDRIQYINAFATHSHAQSQFCDGTKSIQCRLHLPSYLLYALLSIHFSMRLEFLLQYFYANSHITLILVIAFISCCSPWMKWMDKWK